MANKKVQKMEDLKTGGVTRAVEKDTLSEWQIFPESKSGLQLKKQRMAELDKFKKLLKKVAQAEVKVLQVKVKNAFLLTKMQGDFVVVDSNAKGVRRTWSEVFETGALGSNECNMGAKRVQQGLHLAARESTVDIYGQGKHGEEERLADESHHSRMQY